MFGQVRFGKGKARFCCNKRKKIIKITQNLILFLRFFQNNWKMKVVGGGVGE
jgi:hypothetical protein